MNCTVSVGRWCAVCYAIFIFLSLAGCCYCCCRCHWQFAENINTYTSNTKTIFGVYCVYHIMRTESFKCWNWQKTRNVLHMRKTYFSPNFQFSNNVFGLSSIFLLRCKFIRASRDIVLSLSLYSCWSYKPLTDTFYALKRFSRMQIHTHNTQNEKQHSHNGVHTNGWLGLCEHCSEQVNKYQRHTRSHNSLALLAEHEMAKFHLFARLVINGCIITHPRRTVL